MSNSFYSKDFKFCRRNYPYYTLVKYDNYNMDWDINVFSINDAKSK